MTLIVKKWFIWLWDEKGEILIFEGQKRRKKETQLQLFNKWRRLKTVKTGDKLEIKQFFYSCIFLVYNPEWQKNKQVHRGA